MPTIPDDLKNLDISCEDIFEKICKKFKEATRRVYYCFDGGHYEKDKIPTAEIDNDPEDPSHDKTVDVISVNQIIREKKTRPKLELPNDHDRKRPRPLNDHNYFPLKMIGIIKKILGSTRWIPVLLFVAALTYTFFASVRENEPRELQPRQSCLGESAPVYESSGPFNDVDECEHEQKILECTDNSKVKTCFRDHDEKSLYAVCTINICLYDQACPEVTRDLNNALVVHTHYHRCQSCKNRESLQSRLNEYGNVGAECLNISGTSPQPIRTTYSNVGGELNISGTSPQPIGTTYSNVGGELNISGTSPQPIGTNEDDGLDLNVAIPILVLVAIISLGIGLGIGFWCVKYGRDRNNQQNINPEDLEQNGGAGCELLTKNGGAGSERLTQNGGAGSERLTQNGGAGSERLTQNGGAGSERLTQNGGAGSEIQTQNGGAGSERLTQNGGAGSERLTQNGGAGSELLTQNGGAGSELLTQNGGAGSEIQTQNGGAGSERLTQNGGAGSELLTQNGGAGSELLTQNGGAGSELLTQNGGEGSELLTQNGGAGSELLTQNGEEEREPLMQIGGQEVEV